MYDIYYLYVTYFLKTTEIKRYVVPLEAAQIVVYAAILPINPVSSPPAIKKLKA